MHNCTKCGKETRMQVKAVLSAPSSLEGRFSKTNLRSKDVYLMGVNWETADYICEHCRTVENGYGNYVSRLERKNEEMKQLLEDAIAKLNTLGCEDYCVELKKSISD